MPKIIIHGSGGSQLTLDTHTKSSEGLRVFLHRATFARDSSGAFLRPGSHRPETRSKNTPIDATNDSIEWQVDLETPDGMTRGVRVSAANEQEAKTKAEAGNKDRPFKAKGARKV